MIQEKLHQNLLGRYNLNGSDLVNEDIQKLKGMNKKVIQKDMAIVKR